MRIASALLSASLIALWACTDGGLAGGGATLGGSNGKSGGKPPKEDLGQDGNDGDGQDADDDDDDEAGDTDGGTDKDDGDLGTTNDTGNGEVDADDDKSKPSGPLDFTEDETKLSLQECTTATIKFAPQDGEKCPAKYAAYTADDSKSTLVACCPLPAGDVLAKEEPTPRGATCGADEVATGANAAGLLCTKINTKKYKLGSTATSCYVGSGASGSSGAGPCNAPNTTLQAMTAKFGSDACIGQPYGSLITSRTGKNCGDVKSTQLLYKKDGAAVPMFK